MMTNSMNKKANIKEKPTPLKKIQQVVRKEQKTIHFSSSIPERKQL